MGEHIRTKSLKVMGSIETFTVADARRYHKATYSIGLGAGRRFVRGVDLKGRKRIMDIGGGSGAYCIAAAKEHAQIRGVVLDLPLVCEVTREFLAENGVADRVTAQPCDFTRDPFPADCDVAIMASNLPMYGREMIAAVIRKAHDALLPGGEMHLVGEMTNDERTGPWGPAYWGLGQAVADSLGLAHSHADVLGYFEAAGFRDVRLDEFIAGSLDRVSGRKAV
jgi:cyclopropane fatty-acyl-phospholipid synthase-like methyltransferase